MYRKWNKRCPKLFGSQLHIWTKPSYPSRLCPMENCSVPKQQNMMIREGLQTPFYLCLQRINGSADRTTSSPVSTSTNTNVPHVSWLDRRFRSVQLLLTGSYQVFAPGRSAYVSLQILTARDDVLQRSLERVRTHKLIFCPSKPFCLILNVEVTSCGCHEFLESRDSMGMCARTLYCLQAPQTSRPVALDLPPENLFRLVFISDRVGRVNPARKQTPMRI